MVRSTGYGAFLTEAAGIPAAKAALAERLGHPNPCFFTDANGAFMCETRCFGGKPVVERLMPGLSSFFEPNLRVRYDVNARWEGHTFVSSRRVSGARDQPSVQQRRWIDHATGELVVQQEWGSSSGPFIARYKRVR